MRLSSVLLVVALLHLPALATGASEPESPAAGEAAAAVEAVDPGSPRASVQRFLELARQGRFPDAAQLLELPPGVDEGAELARQLKAVLDRHLWIDLEAVSKAPEGNTGDGLPDGVDRLGEIPDAGGVPHPVTLVRRSVPDGTLWKFSEATVARIDAWYQDLPFLDRWVRKNLPAPLLRPGPLELLWWQWIALPLFLAVVIFLGRLLGWGTRSILTRIFRRTQSEWDHRLLLRTTGPIALFWVVALSYLVLPALDLYAPAEDSVRAILRVSFFLAFFWAVFRSIRVVVDAILLSSWAVERPSARSVVLLGGRVARVVVIAIAVVAILSHLGYPVASLVAGLGIGGLALALAAQKTVENLFGAVSLAADQPLRVGDFVKIEDFVGTVEYIGLRSTRVRTLDRTVISLPNGRLADMRIETFAVRDRIRLHAIVGVLYSTSSSTMREILAGIEKVIRDHPRCWQETVVVKFMGFGDSALQIEIMAWFETTDFNEFRAYREEVLLGVMETVERAGSAFAFPTRTVHLVNPPKS